MALSRRALLRCAAASAAALLVFAGAPLSAFAGAASLTDIETDVARRWPALKQMSTAELAAVLAAKDAVLFDVREDAEYAVSHLADAIHADPAISRADFLARYGGKVRGKTVVFYCAVGVRSSKLADRVAGTLSERGASGIYNLTGGMFAWHNEGRPLVNNAGATEFVHPYDTYWGRLLTRQDKLRTKAGSNAR